MNSVNITTLVYIYSEKIRLESQKFQITYQKAFFMNYDYSILSRLVIATCLELCVYTLI